MEADLIATVFKPVEGALFFARQLSLVKAARFIRRPFLE